MVLCCDPLAIALTAAASWARLPDGDLRPIRPKRSSLAPSLPLAGRGEERAGDWRATGTWLFLYQGYKSCHIGSPLPCGLCQAKRGPLHLPFSADLYVRTRTDSDRAATTAAECVIGSSWRGMPEAPEQKARREIDTASCFEDSTPA